MSVIGIDLPGTSIVIPPSAIIAGLLVGTW